MSDPRPLPLAADLASLRSALLRLSTRIAEAKDEDDVCRAVVEGLNHRAFGFDAVGLFLAGTSVFAPQLRASTGPLGRHGSEAAELRTPLRVDHSAIGELVVERVRGRVFDQGDVEILAAAANQASIAIGRARLIAAERQRASEQRALLDTLSDLSGKLELDRLLRAVLERAIPLLGVTGGELAVFDDATRELVVVASLNIGEDSTGTRMALGEGAMGRVAETHEPIIIPNYQEWSGRSGQYGQDAVQAVMVAPLLIGHRLVGAIAGVHSDVNHKFGEGDLHLLNLFASQAAIAIENARLYTAERRRAQEQHALLDTLRALSGELELGRVLQAVLERAVALVGVTGGELAIFDESANSLVIAASHNMGISSIGARMAMGEGAMGQVAGTLEPLIIPRYQEWSGRSVQYEHDAVQTVLAAPLTIGTRLVGAIAIVDATPGREFGDEELRLIEIFAPQASVAIENARLFAAERQRAQEQRALLDTMRDLAGELRLEDLLQRVLERAVALLGVTGGELATYDDFHDELVIVASHNMEHDAVGTRVSLESGAMGHVARTHEPLLIRNYQEWSGHSPQYEQTSVQAVIAIPLLIGERLVGVIAAVHEDPLRSFGDADVALLQIFAPQAAIAIENARLYEASQRYYDALVRNNPVAIANLDLEFRVTACNPAFEQLFGYSADEAVGVHLDALVATGATEHEAADYTRQTLAGRIARGIGQRRRRDGGLVDVELFSIPVRVGSDVAGYLAMYHDITELRQARRDADAANESKSRFLASMSHELRTPLNAVIGYSEMLQEELAELGHTELVPDLQRIHTAGRHLLGLINDILDLSKIEAGKVELYLEDFELLPVLEDVAATVRPLMERNDNLLEVSLPPAGARMYSDVTRIRQVLLNLLSNAAKFTEHGYIRLTVEHSPGESRAHDWYSFQVRDDGIGMTPEQMERLFEAFAQAEASTTKKYGGTGLGLNISRRFARLLGGDLGVQSELGAGSTFTLRLPARVPAAAPAEEDSEDEPHGDGHAGTALIVDDDAGTLRLLRRALVREGYRVVECNNGDDVLPLAAAVHPDVITLDVLMPGRDGWSVLRALKADAQLARIPVLMLTVLDERAMAASLGADEFLMKPINRNELARVLQHYRDARAPMNPASPPTKG